MARFGANVTVASVLLVIFIGGCSLVVDFDRSLLLDAGVDAGADAGPDAAVDALADAGEDETADAPVDTDADAS